MLPMRILFCSCLPGYAKFAHKFLTLFHRPWCNLSLAFLADFIALILSQITLCFSFGSKDMITAFTRLPSYRHSSFTLWAYLCWRHIYCQWPIIELAMNVSPPQATWSRFIRMRVFRGVKKMADLLCSGMPYKQETL